MSVIIIIIKKTSKAIKQKYNFLKKKFICGDVSIIIDIVLQLWDTIIVRKRQTKEGTKR